MANICVIGMGLDGAAGLSAQTQALVQTATVVMGSDRLLNAFPDLPNPCTLGNLSEAIAQLQSFLSSASDTEHLALLTSGDPLFFGLGRLLLAQLPADALQFYPHLSSVQLAFSAIKQPWQDADVVSVHGRSLDVLVTALRRGPKKLAILTDPIHGPEAIARLLLSLELPLRYRCYVCENLGGAPHSETPERITVGWAEDIAKVGAKSGSNAQRSFAPLTVVLLIRAEAEPPLDLAALPPFGLPDDCFVSFGDRPGLITKREVRILALAELAPPADAVVWDIGAGTGSVSVELARLQPTAQVFAVEKTAAGQGLIRRNCDRFAVRNVRVVGGRAPGCLAELPPPDRVFIGGSGGRLSEILERCEARLRPGGRVVLAIATLENFATAQTWLKQRGWSIRLLQAQFSRGTAIANQTRWTPLNPVQLITAQRP